MHGSRLETCPKNIAQQPFLWRSPPHPRQFYCDVPPNPSCCPRWYFTLFSRDVHKLDRQDDNAAVRLFSAETLRYLADNHPDFAGEIVYLFVFGELIDAHQNRTIPHAERLKLVLRARYFLDSWEVFLDQCGYRKDHYDISREACDTFELSLKGLLPLSSSIATTSLDRFFLGYTQVRLVSTFLGVPGKLSRTSHSLISFI